MKKNPKNIRIEAAAVLWLQALYYSTGLAH